MDSNMMKGIDGFIKMGLAAIFLVPVLILVIIVMALT
jgi:hypothetical protein